MVQTIKHLLSQETTVHVPCETKSQHILKYIKDIMELMYVAKPLPFQNLSTYTGPLTQKATVPCKKHKSAFILRRT